MRGLRGRVRRPGLLSALGAMAALACGGPREPARDADALLQTSSLRYELHREELGWRVTVPYTFRNDTGGPVYLPNCEGDIRPLLQVERNGAWFDAWRPFTVKCQSPPVAIPAGDTLADTLRVFGAPAGSNLVPAFAFEDVEGVYRLLWYQAVSSADEGVVDPDALLPLPQRVSNRFLLER